MGTIDEDFGAILIGLVVGSILFGVSTLQTHLYYQKFPNDSIWIQRFVLFIWFVDAMHVVLCTHTMYHYLVTNFNNPPALTTTVWSLALQTDCNGLIGMLVELFFARRVYKLSGNVILTLIICILSLVHFTLGVYFTVMSLIFQEFSRLPSLIWVTCLGLGSAAVADLLIAGSMVFFLKRARTGIPRTDSIITTLIVYAINTGLATSIVAVICVICFALMPINFIWLSFFWILGKLYANSLLANLNAREALRGPRSRQETVILPLSQMRSGPSLMSPPVSPISHKMPSPNKAGIHVNVTTETVVDMHGRRVSHASTRGQQSRGGAGRYWNNELHISEHPPRGIPYPDTSFPEFASVNSSRSEREI